MGTISLWDENDGPYTRNSNGVFIINGGDFVKTTNLKPRGFRTSIAGYMGKSGTNFEEGLGQFVLRPTKYWGLISDVDKIKWTKVQLWEYYYGGQFVGMPRRRPLLPPNSLAVFAAYFAGDYVSSDRISSNPNSPKAGPVFRFYARGSKDYYAILDDNEFRLFKDSNQTPTIPASPPIGGGRGLNPGWDGTRTPPSTGPGGSAGITIGTNPPSSGDAQDIAWWLNYPPAASTNPNTTNPNTNKPNNKDKGKGQWVTGPDGKSYYLPPGIDFAGLQREYDRTHPKPETKIVVRMPGGYLAPVPTKDTKPRMTQRFTQDPSKIVDQASNKDRDFTVTETFMFPYIPQNIRYSDIGSQWQEIPRALNTSFVDWVGYKLMKVSMDFLVTEKMQVGSITTPNVVSDGLFNSVGAQLDTLRRMATNKHPVTLEGLDDILSVQMARSRSGSGRGLEFVIQDLNITAGRRTVDMDTGLATNPSNIAAAQVSLTLQEIPIETVTIVKLPPLNLGTPLVGKNGGGGGGVPTLGLQSDLLTGLKWAVP
jgi:hypothetical protein